VNRKNNKSSTISLVIPGKNVERTIGPCLDAVCPLLDSGELSEILFVDDASNDGSASVARRYPVRLVSGTGAGPGAARNRGWREAQSPWIWFVDADCVAEPDALRILAESMAYPGISGIGGSYGNAVPGSLLACMIHEEIVERHLSMPREVDYLATFNVLYRREMLEQIDGFDEYFKTAQDAELAYRIAQKGGRLLFDIRSRVKHFHPTHLWPYLRVQARHGYYRVWMYVRHSSRIMGDAYSSMVDHVQPLLAMVVLILLPLVFVSGVRWWPLIPILLLAFAQIPMTQKLIRRVGLRYGLFAALSFARSFARGIGMIWGVLRLGTALIGVKLLQCDRLDGLK
jgi:glycosyltransferase involved in cell wall biosynthesis